MLRLRNVVSRALVVLALGASSSLAGGPPVLTLESPARAFDKATQDAAVIVRASQCGDVISAAVEGRAEGIVNGERRTIPLRMRLTSKAGTWSVAKQWPDAGRWILVFTVENHGQATATLDLRSGSDATPRAESIARRLEAREIEARLRS